MITIFSKPWWHIKIHAIISELFSNIFSMDWYFITLLFFIGLYCLLISRNIIKQLIGLEIMSKACLLAIILSGVATNNIHLAQAIAITMILIEAIVITVGLSLLFKFYKANDSIELGEPK